jgi:hypothetical protein
LSNWTYNKSLLAIKAAHQRHDDWRAARNAVQVDRRGRGTMPHGVDQLMATAATALSTFQSATAYAQQADYKLEQTIRKDLDPEYVEPQPRKGIFSQLNATAV